MRLVWLRLGYGMCNTIQSIEVTKSSKIIAKIKPKTLILSNFIFHNLIISIQLLLPINTLLLHNDISTDFFLILFLFFFFLCIITSCTSGLGRNIHQQTMGQWHSLSQWYKPFTEMPIIKQSSSTIIQTYNMPSSFMQKTPWYLYNYILWTLGIS